MLTYPVVNLVVEPDGAALHGPHTAVSHRDLQGRGWAVGALLRPAAVPALLATLGCQVLAARDLLDREVRLTQPDLVQAVTAAMASGSAERHVTAVAALGGWLSGLVPGPPTPRALLANALFDLVHSDAGVGDVADAARRLGTSTRTAQRIAVTYSGFTPTALIRRRRLQDAADRLREDPGTNLADLAHELGYADHAHLTRDFGTVLGFTPSSYRLGDT